MSDATAEALDGMLPFVALLAVLGEPTKDGRTLTADGKFDLREESPLLHRSVGHEPMPVGVLAGLLRRGDRLFAVGVADWAIADCLNAGTLCLGMDLDGMKLTADPMTIKQGTIRAARVVDPEEFAWTRI